VESFAVQLPPPSFFNLLSSSISRESVEPLFLWKTLSLFVSLLVFVVVVVRLNGMCILIE